MSIQQQRHQAMNSAMNAQTSAVSIRQQLLSGTYGTYETGALKETEPVLCIKYTISEDMTKGEQARNKARLSAIADRTGIEPHRSHGTLLLKDRSSFSVPSREVLQKSVTGDTNRPLKKKGQRFFCTEFPPCQLSFTRSEYLARHIRKHAREQPFQCHCSRRFSRLDNLRQHAQMVHINDIPGDSLAATGTRFQREIQTNRVRPPNSRSRANTLGSQGGHSRGHSRNLSASSITSTTSSVSVSVTQPQDSRQRPPPLAMANDGTARARVSLDTYNPPLLGSPGPLYQTYVNQSLRGITTPNSATFSAGTGSPRFPFGLQSPISTVPQSLSWGSRTPGRRLSVASGANPFQGPQGSSTFKPLHIGPLPSSTSSILSQNNGLLSSPTSSIFTESRRDLNAAEAEADWIRRTWHPGTYTSLGPEWSNLL